VTAVSGDAALVAEALRVNARYVEEVVIGWDLCPWAARAWLDGQVIQRVFTDAALDPAPVAAFIDELDANPRAAIGLAIFPRVTCSIGAWDSFAERVRRARAAHPFLAAAFHPDSRAPHGATARWTPRDWCRSSGDTGPDVCSSCARRCSTALRGEVLQRASRAHELSNVDGARPRQAGCRAHRDPPRSRRELRGLLSDRPSRVADGDLLSLGSTQVRPQRRLAQANRRRRRVGLEIGEAARADAITGLQQGLPEDESPAKKQTVGLHAGGFEDAVPFLR
jgi:hypothetical protein